MTETRSSRNYGLPKECAKSGCREHHKREKYRPYAHIDEMLKAIWATPPTTTGTNSTTRRGKARRRVSTMRYPLLRIGPLQPRPRAAQPWRLRSTQREGPRSRGGASSEREGSRRKDKKGSGAGAYGGRRGTRRAGGCRMVGCAKSEGRGGGSEGRGLHLRGSLGAALGGSRSLFLRSAEALSYLGGWASRPRREEQLEMALRGRGGRGRICGAERWD
ncbi:hypothetical protein HPG69_002805 [Diceros bicornis minor]|uniref:Uncharacterized protein n=1 Tax=Diceros bicornis minor TaxID=77932 RepID=A0A7J7ERG9_DICBM|nr:hypothetical protein HPG69_002805 [Diceros bicornis minor]